MATGGLFLYDQLTQRLPRVIGRRYRDLPFENGTLIPTIADLEPGAAEVVRDAIDEVGDAQVLADNAFDIPIVDISAAEDRYKTYMVASAFSYTFQQERAIEFSRQPVTDRKQLVARRSIAERMSRIAAYGLQTGNSSGLVNHPGVTVINSSFNPYSGATADDISGFFIDTIETVHTASNNIEMPSTVLVPTPLYFRLVRTRVPDSAQTLLGYIKESLSSHDIEFDIRHAPECNAANLEANGVQAAGTNKDRLVFYPIDPEVEERHIEQTQMFPQDWVTVKSGRRVFPMFSTTTQTIVNYPGAFRYVDIAKPA